MQIVYIQPRNYYCIQFTIVLFIRDLQSILALVEPADTGSTPAEQTHEQWHSLLKLEWCIKWVMKEGVLDGMWCISIWLDKQQWLWRYTKFKLYIVRT